MCSSRWNLIVRGMVLSEFLRQDGRRGALHVLNECLFFPHVTHDLIAVVPEIGEGGMDGSHAQLREVPDNFVNALPLRFVPDINILYANARACDPGLAAAYAGGDLDVVSHHRRG